MVYDRKMWGKRKKLKLSQWDNLRNILLPLVRPPLTIIVENLFRVSPTMEPLNLALTLCWPLLSQPNVRQEKNEKRRRERREEEKDREKEVMWRAMSLGSLQSQYTSSCFSAFFFYAIIIILSAIVLSNDSGARCDLLPLLLLLLL